MNKYRERPTNVYFTKLLSELANPQKGLPVIHIAGTNGKGSVSTKMAFTLQNAGYKVGLYTSPHIFSFCERIQINQKNISKEDVVKGFNEIFDLIDKNEMNVSFFEATTALAFKYFKMYKLDISAIEVGMGGVGDATNIIDPLISVITSIGLEHTSILGESIEEIAKHKAGIIKPRRPCILGPDLPYELFSKIAKERNAPLIQVDPKLKGRDFDLVNTKIAEAALYALRSYYPSYKITDDIIEANCSTSTICRNQQVPENQLKYSIESSVYPHKVILDVAHNPHATEYLIKKVKSDYPNHPIKAIVGFAKEKDISGTLKEVVGEVQSIHLVEAKHFRALPISTLAHIAKESEPSSQYLKKCSKPIRSYRAPGR